MARVAGSLLAAAAISACFYVPPISSVPQERDSPPFVLGFEPDVVVDLRSAPQFRLSVDAVYDLNDAEEIDWEFTTFLSPDLPFTLDSGTLRVRETQSFPDATEYEGPEIAFPACPTLDDARGDGDIVPVTLLLTDVLPVAQRREGLEQFEVRYTWRVRISGECPQ